MGPVYRMLFVIFAFFAVLATQFKPGNLLQYYVVLNDASCSAVIVRKYVLTAAHCLQSQNTGFYYIQNGRKSIAFQVVRQDNSRDLAVLTSPDLSEQGAELGNTPEIGDLVYLVGNPAGQPGLVTVGFVASVRMMRFYDGCEPQQVYGTAVQETILHTARSFGGSSGGGLFNASGKLVGIHVRTFAVGVGDCQNFIPIEYLWGYAISSRAIQEFMEGL